VERHGFSEAHCDCVVRSSVGLLEHVVTVVWSGMGLVEHIMTV
jgi:hypothetical protein